MRDDSTPGGGEDVEGTPDPPVTLEQLADLQAGLLDDTTAARLRRRIRDDPEVARQFAALQQVRHDLRDLAAAPPAEPPAEVTAAIDAALRARRPGGQPAPVHTNRRRLGPQRLGPQAWIGAAALLVAVIVATIALRHDTERPSTSSAGATAAALTAPRHAGMPLSDRKILDLLGRPADLGPLTDPARLSACLHGLGYSTQTPVLGATVLAEDRLLLVLPESDQRSVMALLVTDRCRADDAGLIADAMLTRP